MARNIEIKAYVHNRPGLEEMVRRIADKGPIAIEQTDYFFPCPNGRLKLRVFDENGGELIHYCRDDVAGPKLSRYLRTTTSEPKLLLEALRQAYGIAGVVAKLRQLYLVGQTRIHLDTVQDLGEFLELEVVLREEQELSDGTQIAESLLESLAIPQSDLIDRAYIDLLVDGRE